MCTECRVTRAPKAALHDDYIDLVYYVLFNFNRQTFLYLFVRFFLKAKERFDDISELAGMRLLPEKILLGAPTFYLPLFVTFVRHGYVYTNYILVSAAIIIGYRSNYVRISYSNIIALFAR